MFVVLSLLAPKLLRVCPVLGMLGSFDEVLEVLTPQPRCRKPLVILSSLVSGFCVCVCVCVVVVVVFFCVCVVLFCSPFNMYGKT